MTQDIEFLKRLAELDIATLFPEAEFAREGLSERANSIAKECGQATRYPLNGGGKLIRPLLVYLFCGSSSFEKNIAIPTHFFSDPNDAGSASVLQRARAAALAVELVHTYSLVHDDLPCMDDDDLRRGIPTTHKVYGEAKALLVGDALLTKAFEILAQNQIYTSQNAKSLHPSLACELLRILASASGGLGMVMGQWLDLSFENSSTQASWADLEFIHKNKTGKLLSACCEMGLLCGIDSFFNQPSPESEKSIHSQLNSPLLSAARRHAQNTGYEAGLAFQIVDDILDVTQSSQVLGKTAGKDSSQNKLTAVAILGMEKAREKAHECTKNALKSFHDMICCLQEFRMEFKLSGETAAQSTLESSTNFQTLTVEFLSKLLQRTF